MAFLDDFKKFAFKGNVIDLAVGVVIGAAFQKIVSGAVANLIMPVVGLVLPDGDWRKASVTLRGEPGTKEALNLTYGQFIGDLLDFIIIAAFLFIFVARVIPALMRKKEKEAAAPEKPSKEQLLLTEIRDLLKAGSGAAKSAEPNPDGITPTVEPSV